MQVNKTLIVASFIIMGSGVYHYFVSGNLAKTAQGAGQNSVFLTKIIIGGYMLALIVSIFDLFGNGVGQVATWIMLLAMGVAIWAVASDLMPRFTKKQQGA